MAATPGPGSTSMGTPARMSKVPHQLVAHGAKVALGAAGIDRVVVVGTVGGITHVGLRPSPFGRSWGRSPYGVGCRHRAWRRRFWSPRPPRRLLRRSRPCGRWPQQKRPPALRREQLLAAAFEAPRLTAGTALATAPCTTGTTLVTASPALEAARSMTGAARSTATRTSAGRRSVKAAALSAASPIARLALSTAFWTSGFWADVLRGRTHLAVTVAHRIGGVVGRLPELLRQTHGIPPEIARDALLVWEYMFPVGKGKAEPRDRGHRGGLLAELLHRKPLR